MKQCHSLSLGRQMVSIDQLRLSLVQLHMSHDAVKRGTNAIRQL